MTKDSFDHLHSETRTMLGYDGDDDLSPAEAMHTDIVAGLRLFVDAQISELRSGQTINIDKLGHAIEQLLDFIPKHQMAPRAQPCPADGGQWSDGHRRFAELMERTVEAAEHDPEFPPYDVLHAKVAELQAELDVFRKAKALPVNSAIRQKGPIDPAEGGAAPADGTQNGVPPSAPMLTPTKPSNVVHFDGPLLPGRRPS
jgi:hypothetical protein